MDPNETLGTMRVIAAYYDNGFEISASDAFRMVELFAAIDGWIMTGGSLPDDWKGSK